MFGSRWEKAEATIVASLPTYSGDGTSPSYEFVADVRPASGAPAFRASLKEPTIAIDFWRPGIGDVVSVLVKSNGKVKFDKDDPRISAKAFEAKRKEQFEAVRNQGFEQARGQEVGSPAAPDFGFPVGNAQVFTVGGGDPERTNAAVDRLRAAGMGGLADQIAQAMAAQPGSTGSGPIAPAAPAQDPVARLGKLENLRERGLLTDDEYAAQRQRILDEI